MAGDISKQLERARRFLERNKFEDAIEAYQSVLNEAPGHMESLQSLGDAHTRLGQMDRAAFYSGLLFDRLIETRDENKAAAVYSRTLKGMQQPPERMMRYATLLQKQNRASEAIEQFNLALELHLAHGQQEAALECMERMAQLDPDNSSRQTAVAALAEELGKTPVATRALVRAGQLAEAAGDSQASLDLFARAHQLAPKERGPALMYAQALMRRGDALAAAELLEPFSGELDAAFLGTLGEALLRSGALDRARDVLLRIPPGQSGLAGKLFELAGSYLAAGEDAQGVALLQRVQQQMVAARHESDFAARLDTLVEAYPASIPLAEFWAAVYAELSREAKYFDALARLFDLYLGAENLTRCCEALEKLVEIDPYDSRNEGRLHQLEGRADPTTLARIRARFSQVATHSAQSSAVPDQAPTPRPEDPAGGGQQTLEDLIVQAEIFVQYSLQAKAVERLQKIASLFPGEEQRNERLRHLCQLAGWWPEGAGADASRAASEASRESRQESADTMRDLGKISEVSQSFLRLVSPRAVLASAVNEIGKYLRATRCLAVIGAPGKPPQMASEFCAPGVEPAAGAPLVRLLAQLERAVPDSLGGLSMEAAAAPVLRELGLETISGVALIDRETQTQAGMVVVGSATPRVWRLSETYFLQAVGDQMLLGVNHLRLRSLTRSIAADEKTGLLARSSYQDCLLNETHSAKSKGTALSLALVQIDHGRELMRQQGEAQLERHLEQLAHTFESIARHSDLAVKYTSWTIAFVLPDTTVAGAQVLAEKLCKAGTQVPAPWSGTAPTLSASVAEALVRPDYDGEDIVTELINRVTSGLEEAAQRGGGAVVAPRPHGQ
jgi:tetratricopeptide (TPR) repeat protein